MVRRGPTGVLGNFCLDGDNLRYWTSLTQDGGCSSLGITPTHDSPCFSGTKLPKCPCNSMQPVDLRRLPSDRDGTKPTYYTSHCRQLIPSVNLVYIELYLNSYILMLIGFPP